MVNSLSKIRRREYTIYNLKYCLGLVYTLCILFLFIYGAVVKNQAEKGSPENNIDSECLEGGAFNLCVSHTPVIFSMVFQQTYPIKF